MKPVQTSALERFLRYVRLDTQSSEASVSVPSTPGQLTLMRMLAGELQALGVADAAVDEFGYLMATLPATAGREDAPAIGFLAHVDTSPEMSGQDVNPIVHRAYDGRDVVLPDDPSMVLRVEDDPELRSQLGNDLVTASGRTLLGADDKAGVAEIVAAAEYLLAHPEIPRGTVRIAFTPDEEIGRGTKHLDVGRFAATAAYTIDGGARGELEYESFSADTVIVTFHGFNTHPGYAKGRMVNALRAAARFVAALPADRLSPETTEGYDGYVHPYVVDGGTERTRVRVLLRDFDTRRLREYRTLVEDAARGAAASTPGVRVDVAVEESYRNMREVLERHPLVVDRAREAIRAAGLEVREKPIRGGTDGSRLSFMGLPTPNLFAGEHNFHSRLEWVSAQDMDAAVAVIVNLCQIWAA
ncbi:MAG TPA: peptidase T [Vicinamibacterales bacterium]|nr:peptidase T [Vicinamibacterales bacterium]